MKNAVEKNSEYCELSDVELDGVVGGYSSLKDLAHDVATQLGEHIEVVYGCNPTIGRCR